MASGALRPVRGMTSSVTALVSLGVWHRVAGDSLEVLTVHDHTACQTEEGPSLPPMFLKTGIAWLA